MKYFPLILGIIVITVAQEQKELEQDVSVRDYGWEGTNRTVSLNLQHGMQAGSIIVIVSQTNQRGTIDICDAEYNNLLHMDTRLLQGRVILNSYFNKTWGDNNLQIKPPPVEKGAQNVATILYEETGYRIFVNGREVAFYEHRSTKQPRYLLAFNNRIFKIIYLAPKEIPGEGVTDCEH